MDGLLDDGSPEGEIARKLYRQDHTGSPVGIIEAEHSVQDGVIFDLTFNAMPGDGAETADGQEAGLPLLGGGQQGGGQRVFGTGFKTGGPLQHLVFIPVAGRFDGG